MLSRSVKWLNGFLEMRFEDFKYKLFFIYRISSQRINKDITNLSLVAINNVKNLFQFDGTLIKVYGSINVREINK